MGATNKTTYYELPQYVQSDKPSYLGDFNGAMNTIDGAIHTNAVNIGINETNITNTNTNIGDLTTLKTSVKTNIVNAINENVDNIGDLTDLTTIVKTSVVDAVNEIVDDFNLTDITTYDKNTIGVRVSSGGINAGSITVATNSKKSICKIYGELLMEQTNVGEDIKITLPTNFVVSKNFTVDCAGIKIANRYMESSPSTLTVVYLKFKTNGEVDIQYYSQDTTAHIMCIPFMIFVKNFGDEPIEE